MYAVIKTGGKQLRIKSGDVVEVERLPGESGGSIVFDSVLLIGDEGSDSARMGQPMLDGACVKATIVRQNRGPKIRTYTYKRRQNSNRRTVGHRQDLTTVKIDSIEG